MRLKLGGGIDSYFGNSLDIQSGEVQGGIDDVFSYESAVGFHLSAMFEWDYSDRWSYFYGLKWYTVGYQFKEGQFAEPTDDVLITPNGSGLDAHFGVCYHF